MWVLEHSHQMRQMLRWLTGPSLAPVVGKALGTVGNGGKNEGKTAPCISLGPRVRADQTTQRDPTGHPKPKCDVWLGIQGLLLGLSRDEPTWKEKEGRRVWPRENNGS